MSFARWVWEGLGGETHHEWHVEDNRSYPLPSRRSVSDSADMFVSVSTVGPCSRTCQQSVARILNSNRFQTDFRRLSAEFSQVKIQTATTASLSRFVAYLSNEDALPFPQSNVEPGICISTCEISADQTPPLQSKSEVAHHLNIESGARGLALRFDFTFCFHLRKFCRQQ